MRIWLCFVFPIILRRPRPITDQLYSIIKFPPISYSQTKPWAFIIPTWSPRTKRIMDGNIFFGKFLGIIGSRRNHQTLICSTLEFRCWWLYLLKHFQKQPAWSKHKRAKASGWCILFLPRKICSLICLMNASFCVRSNFPAIL